ncbi:glycosyltransferase family 2 protein [Salinithrix halophila]|uniref:Glucosyl-3-phosphoglycerate synthase n=1 Tax=Salinithrix halophila TaxID=1485204 RepID=A0ABV8JJT0_9BACL
MEKEPIISAIIPAYNEEERIETTLRAVRRIPLVDEIIVVDDGSRDATEQLARRHADYVIRLPKNRGKGQALAEGIRYAAGDVYLFLDADLERHAKLCGSLLSPVLAGEADMTIARFPPARKKGGFGLVKGLARSGVRRLTGTTLQATLSGQRAVKREVMQSISILPSGFGIELGLTVSALRFGYCVKEVPLPMSHRETGRDWNGFLHRGRQFLQILRTLIKLWRQPV